MPALDRDTVQHWRHMVVVDRDGTTIGTISEFYIDVDRKTRQPTWALLDVGLLSTKQSFVPLIGASEHHGQVQLPYTKRQVTTAPQVDIDGELTPDEEALLFAHYGMDDWADPPREGEAPAPTTAPDRAETIRSEEELQVRPVTRERTRVRLEKYVVTDQVTLTIPVRREEVRLVREPVDEPTGDAHREVHSEEAQGPDMVLHEEQLVIDKRMVPKERVRLAKETVTEHRQVADQVRKEQVSADEIARHEENPP